MFARDQSEEHHSSFATYKAHQLASCQPMSEFVDFGPKLKSL